MNNGILTTDLYKQLYLNKFDNLDEMDKFLEKHSPINTKNQKIPLLKKNVPFVIKTFLQIKS